jgi:hypothetical protein
MNRRKHSLLPWLCYHRQIACYHRTVPAWVDFAGAFFFFGAVLIILIIT